MCTCGTYVFVYTPIHNTVHQAYMVPYYIPMYVYNTICLVMLLGRAKSISELVDVALRVASVQVVSAPLFIADSVSGIATRTLVRSALDVPQVSVCVWV